MISSEATAIAQQRAAADRDLLARLRREGRVRREDGEYERRHPEVARPFVHGIEQRAFADRRNRGMDTIRPKRKKGKKR